MLQMALVMTVFVGLELLFAVVTLLQEGAWQSLLVIANALLSIGLLAWARRLIHRDRLDAAGHWLMIVPPVNLVLVSLSWSGLTPILALGGVLTLFLVGSVALPRRWLLWGWMTVLFAAAIGLVSAFAPLRRYDLTQFFTLRLTFLFMMVALILMLAWYALRAISFGTIRTRLLVSFVFVVLLPGLVVAAGTALFSFQASESRTRQQLESVAVSRQAQLDAWLENLQLNLAVVLNLEAYSLRNLLVADPESQSFRFSYVVELERLQETVAQLEDFDVLFLVDDQGLVVLSTDVTDRYQMLDDQLFFWQGLQGLYTSPLQYSPLLDELAVTVALPIEDAAGRKLGVLAGQAGVDRLNALMGNWTGLGETGEIYLVDDRYRPITALRSGTAPDVVVSDGIKTVLQERPTRNVFEPYVNYAGYPVLGVYRWLPSLDLAMVAEIRGSEAASAAAAVITFNLAIVLFAVLLAVGVALLLVRGIAEPITELAAAAQQIAAGDFSRRAEVRREDEIGVLAQAFNSMTQQVRDIIEELEERVSERTAALERRTTQLEAAAQVSRRAASIRDVDALLTQTARQISAQFGFYHVALFLLDDNRDFAVLHASCCQDGRAVFEPGLELRVGGPGIVGDVTATGEPRVTLDVEEDAHFLHTPELPETRSEMCLPLIVHDEVVGALDVQSEQPDAFTSADLAILQTMADQVALALDNARLLAEAEAQLDEIRRLLQMQSREGWAKLLVERPVWSYLYDGREVHAQSEDGVPFEPQMVLPLEGGREVIGDVKVAMPDDRAPSSQDVELAQTIVDQAGQALESARLFTQMQDALEETGVLYRGGQAVGATRSVDEVLQAFVEHLVTPEIDRCVIALVEPGGGPERWVRIEAAWEPGVDRPEVLGNRWSVDQIPLIAQTLDQVLVIPEVTTAPELDEVSRHVFREVLGMQAVMIVPFMAGEEVLGWLLVESLDEPYAFSEREVRLYRSLADQAALKLQSFRLLEEATRRAEQQQRITEITAQMRATLDMDAILQTALREMGRSVSVSDIEVRMLGGEVYQGQDEVE
jgi:GAF domain-containing protein/HAMP domain-containing protein